MSFLELFRGCCQCQECGEFFVHNGAVIREKTLFFFYLGCTVNLKWFRTVQKPVPLPLRLNVTEPHEEHSG